MMDQVTRITIGSQEHATDKVSTLSSRFHQPQCSYGPHYGCLKPGSSLLFTWEVVFSEAISEKSPERISKISGGIWKRGKTGEW